MKKVIIDTNFLLIPGQFKIDIFTEIEKLMKEPFEMCVVEKTWDELKMLAEGNSKDAMAAKLGTVLAQQKGLKTLSSSKPVDDALIDLAGDETVIATQDKDLKRKVKERGSVVVAMRQKQHLVLEG